jgi:hypothetical protein
MFHWQQPKKDDVVQPQVEVQNDGNKKEAHVLHEEYMSLAVLLSSLGFWCLTIVFTGQSVQLEMA